MAPAHTRIGLISDTHGLLRPGALEFLAGSDHVIHAGDVGGPDILHELRRIAPLTVVRGNNDTDAWAAELPDTAVLTVRGIALYVIHDVKQLSVDPAAAGYRAVIAGHSHHPSSVERNGVLFVNPGSAGRRRFTLPVAVGELIVGEGTVTARIVELPNR